MKTLIKDGKVVVADVSGAQVKQAINRLTGVSESVCSRGVCNISFNTPADADKAMSQLRKFGKVMKEGSYFLKLDMR